MIDDNIGGNEKEERSSKGIPSEDRIEGRPEVGREPHESGEERAGHKRGTGTRGKEEEGYIIYGLIGKPGKVFYVGKTKSPGWRLIEHRFRFGPDTAMMVLQDSFIDETVDQAEMRIISSLDLLGWGLVNKAATRASHPYGYCEINVPLNGDVVNYVSCLAHVSGLSRANWVRRLINAEIERSGVKETFNDLLKGDPVSGQ
jgi:hypothetical protein